MNGSSHLREHVVDRDDTLERLRAAIEDMDEVTKVESAPVQIPSGIAGWVPAILAFVKTPIQLLALLTLSIALAFVISKIGKFW